MSLILLAILLLSFGGSVQGKSRPITYYLRHPQEQFCSADFVVRAKVLPKNYSEDGRKHKIRTYHLEILKIYKGKVLLENKTNSVKGNSSGNTSLAVKVYSDTVVLKGDAQKEYLIAGLTKNGQIHLNIGSWIEEWTEVTRAYKQGIRGIYGKNCECHITPCFGTPCDRPLKGCDVSPQQLRVFYKGCEWYHSLCLKNIEKNACYWNKTAEYRECRMRDLP